ncbi:MAG: glycogen debranching protein GlgX [Candidatus Eremiobacteraeota bacterium]|nr:glycogen debranching protein GlgX [Candidatus Eremiobacteraeota bacterium]
MIGARRADVLPGRPYPLGATWNGAGVNFALFSENAEKVELCLFDPRGRREVERIVLPEYTDSVWHAYLPDARPGLLYGYRVYGPYDPANGHRFNHHKLLLDPYAALVSGGIVWSDAHFGYRVGSPRADLSFDRRDNAAGMPKCVVVDTAFTWGNDRQLHTRWHDLVVYELHVRGYTMKHQGVPPERRGTIAGLASPAVIEYLVRLGVNAVELLPVQNFVDDRHLIQKGLRNYWGYSPISFFAPVPRYLSRPDLGEFKTMVSRMHAAGIEVILDVVYNHTAEGSELGPTLSFRGIDNKAYYRLAGEQRYYEDATGCGNMLDLSHPNVLKMVTDSLRYWVTEMHVDGFRFDLATTLARTNTGEFGTHSNFLASLEQDPRLSRVKIIAEPWDLGPGGYHLGDFPAGWSEWNDRFRDGVRRFWRGDGALPEMATRLTGSSDVFDRRGRRPRSSVNFVTAHDGFTLHDLVSYDHKHNEANLEENRDGADENYSWNCGAEGPTNDSGILALRERQKRNFLATLLLSQGLPMLLAGDELGHTQLGNNNAYCQDNEIGWLDRGNLLDASGDLFEFVRTLIALRRAHPVFRRPRFFRGVSSDGSALKDITWFTPDGREMTQDDWYDTSRRCIGALLGGDTGDRFISLQGYRELDDSFLLVINGRDAPVEFTLPPAPADARWKALIDTMDWTPPPDAAPLKSGALVRVADRSLVLYAAAP